MNSNVKEKLKLGYTIYDCYKHIIDSYVSDYYVENHWSKLPKNWQTSLENISVDQVAELLDFKKPITKGILSLSLLCVRNIIINIIIPRDNVTSNVSLNENEEFLKYFWKNVKLKKRHEIEKIAQICYETAVASNCFYIVDIGSGLGHLSRMLSYEYGLKVCTLEANSTLSEMAKQLDKKLEMDLKRKSLSHKKNRATVHLKKKLEHNIDWKCFLNIVLEAFNENSDNFKFGIVGLHPCGNLGSTLLRLYNECSNVMFINMASCCYMKLTLYPDLNPGFPLSDFCRKNGFQLSYLACEIACHAIENYTEKLRSPEDYSKLKIHAYRAQLENLLISLDTKFKHSAVPSVKYKEGLSFRNYCDKIFSKHNVLICNELMSISENVVHQTWKNVVVFYSLRLLFAPLIETIILLDRLLYIKYSNSDCKIVPLFNCNISPRNHVLSAIKRNI